MSLVVLKNVCVNTLKPHPKDAFLIKNIFQESCLFKKSFFLCRKMSLASPGEMMKAWQTNEFRGIEGIHLASNRIPLISKPSQVLVKVSAASVNPLDTAALDGYGKEIFESMRKIEEIAQGCNTSQSQFPLIVGRDFAGEVVHVGQDVSNVQVKDKVWGVVLPQQQGSHAQYVVTESYNVRRKPESLSEIEAASIPYVGLTAWSTVVITGGFRPHDCYDKQVLIIGISGGIGTFLSQLLHAWGAKVVGICSQDAFELAHSVGAVEVYDSKDEASLSNLRFQPRFDLIIDAGESNNFEWTNALKEWNNASYIILSPPLIRNIDEQGLLMGFAKSLFQWMIKQPATLSQGKSYKWAFFMPCPTALEEIGKLIDNRKIRPVIDKIFKMEDGKSAYEHMINGPRRGKTVIDFTT